MLKGIALFDEKQEEEAKLEVDLLQRLGSGLLNSIECQKRDWKEGNHKQTCPGASISSISRPLHVFIT